MSSKSWHASTLGTRPLAPETLMMGYGYDPHFELAYGLRQKRPNEELPSSLRI